MPAQIGSQFRGTFELDAAPFDWGKDYARPYLAPEDVVVYEMGVRSFTADGSSGVGKGKEGTYAGLMAKARALTNPTFFEEPLLAGVGRTRHVCMPGYWPERVLSCIHNTPPG